jgi:hypothetical protein
MGVLMHSCARDHNISIVHTEHCFGFSSNDDNEFKI